MITVNTLNFWLDKQEINIQALIVFALISIPYAINSIWVPIRVLTGKPFLLRLTFVTLTFSTVLNSSKNLLTPPKF